MPSKRNEPRPEACINIGIDFGTTYSGVAHASSSKPNDIENIMRWESVNQNNEDLEKVPTVIHFNTSTRWAPRETTWGLAVPDDKKAIEWFKLLLVDEQNLPDNLRDSERLRDAMVNICRFNVVITVPAMWSLEAQMKMRTAAKMAGILSRRLAGETTLTLVAEPEAAALATLADMGGEKSIEKDDILVIADCGGGTCGLCGAITLEDAFKTFLRRKMGPSTFDQIPSKRLKIILREQWENGIRNQFTGHFQVWTIDVPFEAIPAKDRANLTSLPTVKFNADELKEEVFKPVFTNILALIRDQIKAVGTLGRNIGRPKYIMLVGGFGRCPYLYRVVTQKFGIEVLQSTGAKPWTAVSRGAVIHAIASQNIRGGVAAKVESRIARASYGYNYHDKFEPGKHREEDKIWSEVFQHYRADQLMTWFLQKGQVIKNSNKSFKTRYLHHFSTMPEFIEDYILTSKATPVPDRNNDQVEILCTIKWQSDLGPEQVPKFVNKEGDVFYEVEYELDMTYDGATVEFAIWHNGKKQGAEKVGLEFQQSTILPSA
ncbi:hypothetical protein M406DRAFT_39951 [Cryphonectria parasitica EP155]|uniref:Actin-like ATPase domain-containing protein n=1 Tax=Cryphonectria parasitica (strain ATCC 38755 / EP155) TaxID=660469 RepID=A0A9P5CQ57_CRYP1|nr:uncharacterized protein M406DRAFT_39951 [Cryphonectria parasitica EP155]KAF3767179.1 hypothetical protein M406DRAFT_39951 [Cryphonectria parasitica EP155]